MQTLFRVIAMLAAVMLAAPAIAQDEDGLQCVPYARQVSGIPIYGDAHTWWGQAAGKYERGSVPQIGAVLAFKPHGIMRLGHVAAVSRIIDSRTILVRHSNWSIIDGRRGQIEDNVAVVDVSADNDWRTVRVWYTPIAGLGTTAYPVEGFIYSGRAPKLPPKPLRSPAARPTLQFASAQAITSARSAEFKHERAAAPAPPIASGQASGPHGDPIGDLLVRLGQ